MRPSNFNTAKPCGPKSTISGSSGIFNLMGGFLPDASRTMQTAGGMSDDLFISKLGGSTTRATGVGSKLRQTLHVTQRESDRIERFKTVRENTVELAIDKQARSLMRDHKDKNRQKAFKELLSANEEKRAYDFKAFYEKHTNTLDRFSELNKSYDIEGVKAMKIRIRENNEYLENKRRKELEDAMSSAQNLKILMEN
jgi:hypothetical protein